MNCCYCCMVLLQPSRFELNTPPFIELVVTTMPCNAFSPIYHLAKWKKKVITQQHSFYLMLLCQYGENGTKIHSSWMPMVKPCLGFNSPLGNKQKSKPKTSKFSIEIKLSNNFAIITTPSSCNLFSSEKTKKTYNIIKPNDFLCFKKSHL